jgi:predicted patatin/cPLA2 family phospholipase
MSSNVLENIRVRSAEMGDQRASTIRTALVVPGGVLRSICNCASLAALNNLGIRNFDSVYAVSAGAINAAYALADQAALGVTVYLEEVNKSRIINLFRFWNIIDLDYLFTRVIQSTKRLDVEALRANPSELRILTADVTNGEARWFTAGADDLMEIMRAACSPETPFSRPVSIGAAAFRDGYLLEPLPLLSALKENYTDILVLLNRPVMERDTPNAPWLQKAILNRWNRKAYGERLVQRCENGWRVYNQALDIIHSGTFTNEAGWTTRIAAVGPDLAIGMFESKAKTLFETAYSSWKNTIRAFETQESSRDAFLKVLGNAGLKHSTLRELAQ